MSITLIIVGITVLISYFALENQGLSQQLRHSPYIESRNKEYWRMLTSGFIHGSWIHLGINMFVLYSFGREVEFQFLDYFGDTMGRINFLLLYLLAIIFADIPTFFKHKNNPHFASVGASGAVSAVLFVSILFDPWSTILLYAVIPIPAILGGVGYLIYSSWASKNSRDNIDHDAHFWGAVFGVLFAIALKPLFAIQFADRLINGFPF